MIDQNFTLCDDTNQRLEKYFGTGNGIYTVNFVKQEKTTRKINALVEADTNHGVQSFVKDEFAAGSCAVLTQVMFFKGQWEKGFKREDVRMHPFWINDKETCQVEMMFGRVFDLGFVRMKTNVDNCSFFRMNLNTQESKNGKSLLWKCTFISQR